MFLFQVQPVSELVELSRRCMPQKCSNGDDDDSDNSPTNNDNCNTLKRSASKRIKVRGKVCFFPIVYWNVGLLLVQFVLQYLVRMTNGSFSNFFFKLKNSLIYSEIYLETVHRFHSQPILRKHMHFYYVLLELSGVQ